MLGSELAKYYPSEWSEQAILSAMSRNILKNFPAEQRKRVQSQVKDAFRRRKAEEAREEARLSQLLPYDTLMRFAYVPFVIARLAWDYIDTITDMAAYLRIAETKPLCRAVKQLKAEYNRIRAPFTDFGHCKSEESNMYVFEENVADTFNLLLVNVGADLQSEYPDLEEDQQMFLKAVYQAHVVLQSIYKYVDIQTAKIAKLLNKRIGDVLPSELRRVDGLVMAFVGDKPISKELEKQLGNYSQILCNRMLDVELVDQDNECKLH